MFASSERKLITKKTTRINTNKTGKSKTRKKNKEPNESVFLLMGAGGIKEEEEGKKGEEVKWIGKR